MRGTQRKTPSAPSFHVGQEVEVRFDQEGYDGAWFRARVVRALNQPGYYTVVFRDLLDDHDHTLPLEETVPADYIRPTPPSFDGIKHFHRKQMVDALDKDAWWVGVVDKIKKKGNHNRYTVMFDQERCKYWGKELRPHIDWIGGEWKVPESHAEWISSEYWNFR